MRIRLGMLRQLIREAAYAGAFKRGDPVMYGKYKNKSGKIKKIYNDEKDHATIDVEPVPKGRKDDVTMGLYRVWPGKEKEDLDEAIVRNDEWVDDRGYINGICTACGTGCSDHPDAGASLTYCGDCNRICCNHCADKTMASRCPSCAALHAEENLDEVDLDPTNNPGRPDDAFEYLGMHPSPTAAMSHPFADGGGGDGGAGSDDTGEPETEPTKET